MTVRSCLLALWVAAVAVTAARGAEERVLLDGVAAMVDGEAITIGDVLARIQGVRRRLAMRYRGEELREKSLEAYRKAMDALIERTLVLELYVEQEGQLPEWAVDNRINEIIHEMFDDDRSALMETLAEDHLTYDEWRGDIREQLIVASMRQEHVYKRVNVSARDVQDRYRENLDDYRVAGSVQLRMIVLKKPTTGKALNALREKAAALREELIAGGDFEAAARTFSAGYKAQEGGDWGWVDPRDLRPELRDALQPLEAGDIAAPVETNEEIYIVKVEGRRDEQLADFEDVQDEIEKALRAEQAERLYRAWIDALRASAYIKIVTPNPFDE